MSERISKELTCGKPIGSVCHFTSPKDGSYKVWECHCPPTDRAYESGTICKHVVWKNETHYEWTSRNVNGRIFWTKKEVRNYTKAVVPPLWGK